MGPRPWPWRTLRRERGPQDREAQEAWKSGSGEGKPGVTIPHKHFRQEAPLGREASSDQEQPAGGVAQGPWG